MYLVFSGDMSVMPKPMDEKLELLVLNTDALLSIRSWLLESLVKSMNGTLVTDGKDKPYVVSCTDGLLFVLCLYLPGGSEITAFPSLAKEALVGNLRKVWENHRSVDMTIAEVIELANGMEQKTLLN